MARVALINEDSACFYLFTDWPAILPSLRAHYDHIVAVSISDMESESSELYDPEFEDFRASRRKRIAGLCDAVVEIDFPYAAAAAAAATVAAEDEDDYGYEQITERTCEIANALLRKTPVEIRSLPACGAIPFRDWMALVA